MRMSAQRLGRIGIVIVMTMLIAACNPFATGSAPTLASLEATSGPMAIASVGVPSGNGFAGGTIYHPTDSSRTYGVVAIAPGWTNTQSTTSWYGPRIASHGFVVITMDINNTFLDFPDERGVQMLAALDWVSNSSAVAAITDGTRQAVMGNSMGGGGALSAAAARPSIKAVVGLVPWHTTKSWSQLATPGLIIVCEDDSVAPPASHGQQFYDSLNAGPKSIIELAGEGHSCATTNGSDADNRALIGSETVSWLKRYVDDDTRYDPFVCPSPAVSVMVSAAESNCP